MKKTILIPGYKSADGTSYGVGNNYLEFVSEFGNPRIMMPYEEYVEGDMLFLPGGLDIAPRCYGEVPRFKTTNQDVFKQHFFDNNLKNYVGKIPIFGVCLGFQALNVFFGGTLRQNLKFHKQSSDRWEDAHEVHTKDGKFTVNSHHHQAVMKDTLAADLEMIAHCKDKSEGLIVEAFKHRTLPIAGVQWHPEEFYDKFSAELMLELINQ
jgi:putative glutamine amidotransferase